ncbi:hypothetical protein PVAR5_8221 [Paecilomyces variotii No. 5]|uniref:GPI anchored protein n=1 Tax=Byssochlamys spectabilis (strain No. 5 / NBRC 109023) TaxID=1356009 RepID=V5GBS5_BYSSN|nr:hypothetical protein PVAR5_8221 [Paecilomyces variotii No. 5]
MIASAPAILLGAIASVVAAQTVDIFLPEYGRYSDSLVAQNVGEDAGVTTYLIGCGPQELYSLPCFEHPTGVGRDGETPPICTGDLSYNTYMKDSCVASSATLLEGPSTIVFINPSDNNIFIDCSVAGTESAICTMSNSELSLVDTISGDQFSFYHVPLTTGLTANGPLPTLKAGGSISTSSTASRTSFATSLSPKATVSTVAPSTTPIITPSASLTSSNHLTTSSNLSSSSHITALQSTTQATPSSSNTATATPIATETDSGATALSRWMMGAAAAAVVAVAAIL